MFASRNDPRQPDTRANAGETDRWRQARDGGSLLSVPADDAVSVHAMARSRRMRRPSPLLTSEAVDNPVPRHEQEPHDGTAAAAELADTPSPSRHDDEPEFPDVDPFGIPGEPEREASGNRKRGERRPGLVAGLTLAGAALGAALSLWWPSGYVATSEVMVDPGRLGSGAVTLDHNAAMTIVDSQARMLRSGTILGAAVDRLNLAADGEFGKASALPALDMLFGSDQPGSGADRATAIRALSEAITVERAAGTSIITIAARSGDAGKSALIANTLAELFVAEAGSGTGMSLTERRDALEEAERAVEAYKREHELIDAQGRLITDDEIVRLGEYLTAARARTVELNARAASTRDANVDSIVTGSLPEQFSSTTLPELRSRHAELKQQLDRLSVKLGPRHPERLAAQAELEGSRQEIASELRRVAGAVQTELKRAVEQEQKLASELARMKVRQGEIGTELVALRDLEREAAARREAYEQGLRAAQSANGPASQSGTSIISAAVPPASASGPSMMTLSLAGGIAGLLAGLGLTRRRREPEGEAPSSETNAADAAQHTVDTAGEPESGKEADAMYPPQYPHAHPGQPAPEAPYHHQQQGMPAQPATGQQPHVPPYPPQAWQQPVPVAGWAMQPPPPPQPAPQPQAAYPGYAAVPPMHDPWAQQRAAMQAPAYYAPPPPAPVQTVVYVPMPMPQATTESRPETRPAVERSPHRAGHDEPSGRRQRDDFDQDRYIDQHTNAAIEEIRQSLREFREAIEDLADSRYDDRRFGT